VVYFLYDIVCIHPKISVETGIVDGGVLCAASLFVSVRTRVPRWRLVFGYGDGGDDFIGSDAFPQTSFGDNKMARNHVFSSISATNGSSHFLVSLVSWSGIRRNL